MDTELTEEKRQEIVQFCRDNQDTTFEQIAARFDISPKLAYDLFLDSLF